MLSEKSQRTENGTKNRTMFVDLDWPLNARIAPVVSISWAYHVAVGDGTAFRSLKSRGHVQSYKHVSLLDGLLSKIWPF